MDKGMRTKQRVMEAALELFNVNGYSGTSVRAIASKAGVNGALISYYFGNKQGLLEQLMINFLEGYTNIVENSYRQLEKVSAKKCLYMVVTDLLKFQQQNHHLARFVHREVTLDSTLVRELMMTYFMKEKHYVKAMVEAGMKKKEFRILSSDFIAIQLRAFLTMPYSQPQYIREVYHLQPNEDYFVQKYIKHVEKWLNEFLYNDSEFCNTTNLDRVVSTK